MRNNESFHCGEVKSSSFSLSVSVCVYGDNKAVSELLPVLSLSLVVMFDCKLKGNPLHFLKAYFHRPLAYVGFRTD